jgi:cold shock CspA family protein
VPSQARDDFGQHEGNERAPWQRVVVDMPAVLLRRDPGALLPNIGGTVMQDGVIKRMGAKGFGFIVPDDERGDVFFNIGDCHLRNKFLQVGDRVLFEVNQFARQGGRRVACEVRRVK